MEIGNVKLDNILCLAPMAGIGDRAFRELNVSFGAGYTVTEMVSAKGITMGDKKSGELLTIGDEHPTAIQLFGSEPETVAKAAQKVMKYSPDVIDINMGCPAPKVANNGSGSTLMKNPKLCGEIVSAVTSAVDIPVTVKMRKGWDADTVTAKEVALAVQNAGAAAVFLHGRTREEMYSGKADLNIIKEVKSVLDIPLIGNGDIADEESATFMLEKTNCDGIMIGRGAMGNPWIFRKLNAYFSECRVIPDPTVIEKMAVMLRHIEKIIEYKGEHTAMLEARHHAAYYTKGLRGGASLRREISAISTFEQLCEISYKIVKDNE